MKLWYDNRFLGILLWCLLFLFGLVIIANGFDVYNGIIIVGVVLIIAFKLFEKYIKRWRE
jgi:cell division protein FtsW (lipid II flippase)